MTIKNSSQLSKIIDRLWARTQDGTMKWSQVLTATTFETRLGDFSISLSGPGSNVNLERAISISVKKLDGTEVVRSGTSQNALMSLTPGYTQLTQPSQDVLTKLWEHVSNRDTDLDELLRILG